jgi:hypothetical protein
MNAHEVYAYVKGAGERRSPYAHDSETADQLDAESDELGSRQAFEKCACRTRADPNADRRHDVRPQSTRVRSPDERVGDVTQPTRL